MLYLKANELQIVHSILYKHPYTFYAFGSRIKGTHRDLSDLDIVYKDAIPLSVIAQIEGAFEESDLPFKVDLIAWRHCNETFRTLITQDLHKI